MGALVLGFGVGEAMQSRWPGYPMIFTGADLVGWGMIFASMGDCNPADKCRRSKHRTHAIGLGLLAASRLAQVIDTSLWSYQHYQDTHPRVTILPSENGFLLSAELRF